MYFLGSVEIYIFLTNLLTHLDRKRRMLTYISDVGVNRTPTKNGTFQFQEKQSKLVWS